MKRLSWVMLVALLTAGGLYAQQQAAPSEPQIVLPPVLLKVQDVTQEKIDTPLPQEQAPSLPQINIALPTAQNINLGNASFEVPVPTQGPSGAPIAAAEKPASAFFSDGLIGAGSMNHILGDITLYKLGSDPRFNLEFSHEGFDGYLDPTSSRAFQPAGAGFFNRKDALVGSLTYATKNLFKFNTHDFYRETENGLQGNATTYSSVTHRFISGSADGEYTGTSPFSFGGAVDATSGDMSLAGPTPASALNARVLAVNPSVNVGVSLPKISGHLSGFYDLSQMNGQSAFQRQSVGGKLSLNVQLPLNLTFDGSVGTQWNNTIGWAVPFSLELDGAYKDILTYRLYGGYRVVRQSYFDLWQKYPFLNQSVSLIPSLEWYGGVSTSWYLGPHFRLRSGVDFSSSNAAILPTSPAVGNGLFDFVQGQATTLGPSLSFSWEPKGPFSLNLGWLGNFLQPAPFVPVSTFTLDAELNSADGRYGGALSGSMDLTSLVPLAAEMPNLSLSGYFRISSGVSLHLNMSDLLSPLSSGRKTWNYYYEPGFHVTVTTQISL